jgi:hypothetical protein
VISPGANIDCKEQTSYSRGHLLPPDVVFCSISLAEDVVPAVLEAKALVIPVGPFIPSLVVHPSPDLRR